ARSLVLAGRLGAPDRDPAELGEHHLAIHDLLDLDAGDPDHAIAELVTGGPVAFGNLAALPERQPQRCSLARDDEEADEALQLAEPAVHLLADDGGGGNRLVEGVDAGDGDVHPRL